MNAKQWDKIAKIIAVKHGFFIRYLVELDCITDDKIPTLCTDGKELRYNPTFLFSLPFDQQVFCVVHELAHVFFLHPLRKGKADHELFNMAADYAVNDFLHSGGMALVPGCLFDGRFHNWAWEKIYHYLQQEQKEKPEQAQARQQWDPNKHGEVKKSPATGTPSEQKEIEQAERKQRETITTGKLAGKLPHNWQRIFDDIQETSINWKDALAELIERSCNREDFSYVRPSRRFADDSVIHPGMYSEETPAIAVVGDTSGSISREEMTLHTGAVVEILDQISPETIHVIWCDCRVQATQTYGPYDRPRLHPVGGGGTDFRPPFDYISSQNIVVEALVYLTDGECSSFPAPPPYPVFWVLWRKNRSFRPPFGTVLQM